jgi:predicted ArsR family transcriptional regulator
VIPDTSARRRTLDALKRLGTATIAEIADHLAITHEAARMQVNQLESDDLVVASSDPASSQGGRPARRFRLTRDGEHTFAKHYGELAGLLLDTVHDQLGPSAIRAVLAAAVDAKVAAWRPALARTKSLRAKLEVLRSIYVKDDPWVEVTEEGGRPVLIERNCPYLDIATGRPALCSLTVHSLGRLLGRKVERVRRFQDGDGMCAFVILEEPLDADAPLRLESDPR